MTFFSKEEKQFLALYCFLCFVFMAWLIPCVGWHVYDTIFSGCHSLLVYWTFFLFTKSWDMV